MTSSLRYTPLRHRMLAEVDADRGFYVVAGRSNGTRTDLFRHRLGKLSTFRQRTLRLLASIQAVQASPSTGVREERPLAITDAGSSLLSEWTAEHGNPLADQGKDGPTA